jgi:uncharacterized protein
MKLNGMASISYLGSLHWFALLAITLALAACSDIGNPTPNGSDSSPSPPFFEIANMDGAVEGWLIGTIHALPRDTLWRTPAIDKAISEADFLLLEVAALDDRKKIARIFRQLDNTPDLPPIAERIPDSLQPSLASLTSKGRLDLRNLSRSETWAAALALAQVEAEGDPEHGVDRDLIRAFVGRDVREFEGASSQLQIFDQLPEEAQRDLLVEVIKASGDDAGQAARLRKAWLAGDLVVLEEASQTGILAVPALRAALLTERNQRWMARLESELQGPRRPLIAVGAAHLVGPEGLIALLGQRGYVVKALR